MPHGQDVLLLLLPEQGIVLKGLWRSTSASLNMTQQFILS